MTKSILIGCGILALVGIFFLLSSQPVTSPAPGEVATSSSTTVMATSTSSTVATPKTIVSKPTVKGSGTASVSSGSNMVIAPMAGDKWVAGESHTIQWSQESLGNGSITLIDAKTGLVIGFISPSMSLHQKSFSWNGRDVFIARTGGQKKTVQPGDYVVKVTFEVGNRGAISSGQFSLIYPSQQVTPTQTLTIQNYIISPSKITVKKGDIIYINNSDPASLVLMMSGFPSITIGAGQTVQFQTNQLSVGSYEFYSDKYSGMKAGITVQ